MKKFLDWTLLKKYFYQGITYKKSLKNIYFLGEDGRNIFITSCKEKIFETVKPLLIGYMTEYLFEKGYRLDYILLYNEVAENVNDLYEIFKKQIENS